MNEEAVEIAVAEEIATNPLQVLLDAKAAAYSLSIAGSTYDIRYTATRANDLLGRLVNHMERHRQIVGGPR